MNQSPSHELLGQVARRQHLAALGCRFYLGLLAFAGLYLLLLLVSRLSGLIPPWFTIETVLIVPAAALVLALIWHHRPTTVEAARQIDRRESTHDLFLTSALIHHSLGDYQGVVLAQADRRAAEIQPRRVVAWAWPRPAARASAALLCLGVAVLWLPQLDPFHKEEQRRQQAQQLERLHETIRATQLRTALLAQKPAGENSEEVKLALTDLLKTFQEMKPGDPAGNLSRLNQQQKDLGQLWRGLNEEKLKSALSPSAVQQDFGLGDPAKSARWQSDLQQGETGSLSRELQDLKNLAEKLGGTSDPVARENLRQELANRLQNLADALARQGGSQGLNDALQRALEQLQLSNLGGLSQEALQGLQQSLNLSEEELKQLAQNVRDLQALEQALQALQYAKRANSQQGLDGKQCAGMDQMSQYMALYQSMCGGQGTPLAQGVPGVGMGPGLGVGPRPTADDDLRTAYDPQRTPAALQPGKILLQWKSREVSEPGPAREEYLQALQAARQQASEAIVQEQIPPGYHETIKHYFDKLGEETPAPSSP